MNVLLSAAAAAMLVSLVSCESTGQAGPSPVMASTRVSGTSTPFVGGAPPSASYTPPERYFAFGGGYSSTRRQTEGDDANFLRNAPWCRKHWHCGYYNGGCGYGYGWRGNSCYYRAGCW